MCRYGFHVYKPHYACFACRRAFRRRLPERGYDGPDIPPKCPECGGPVANMGLDFKPPRRAAKAQWRILEQLYEVGEVFHSCGCSGPGYRPRSQRALREYLTNIVSVYQGHLRAAESQDADDPEGRIYVERWHTRIEAVEAQLSRLGV